MSEFPIIFKRLYDITINFVLLRQHFKCESISQIPNFF